MTTDSEIERACRDWWIMWVSPVDVPEKRIQSIAAMVRDQVEMAVHIANREYRTMKRLTESPSYPFVLLAEHRERIAALEAELDGAKNSLDIERRAHRETIECGNESIQSLQAALQRMEAALSAADDLSEEVQTVVPLRYKIYWEYRSKTKAAP